MNQCSEAAALVVLWGIPDDSPIRAVCAGLEKAGANFLLLDQFEAASCRFEFATPHGAAGRITSGTRSIELDTIASVYPRPYDTARVEQAAGCDTGTLEACRVAEFNAQMLAWLELTGALVVNRPSAMTSNASKPLQSDLIAQAGFDVPATLITSDPEHAAAFQDRFGRVIYKSISGVRSRVAELGPEMLRRMHGAACPLQLQQYVSGCDLRVHVLGDMVFPCSIDSDALDYRYGNGATRALEIRPCELPDAIAEQCVLLTRQLGLAFAGIDLRHTDDGRWVCFEANPSPGYTFYQEATGVDITTPLVQMLQHGTCS